MISDLERLKPFFVAHDRLEDKAYVLFVGNQLLKITWPDVVDGKGYDKVDMWPVWNFILSRDWERYKLTDEQIEWLRRKLLRYKKQIEKLGLDFERLERVKFSDTAIYWKRVLSDSKFAKSIRATLEVKKDVCITIAVGFHDTRDKEITTVEMSREDAKKKAFASWPLVSFDGRIDHLKMLMEKETAVKFIKTLGIPFKYEWKGKM